jgi:minor extracellular serine protease Vpr
MALPLFGARLEEYALVLNDPPLARQVSARARIQAAQHQVRAELVRRHVRVSGSAQTLLNAVFVRAPRERAPELRSIAGVKHVVWLPPLKRNLNVAVNLVNIPAAWSALSGGMANAGAGVKIAVIDSGLDDTHPAFQDVSLTPPATYPRGDTTYTNGKIIVARSYESLFALPDDPTPRDRSGHGTALAMIAAGGTVAAPLATITGVAPKAWLGNYKIFGTPGVNDNTTYAALIQALEDAVSDQMDIAVLAIGSLPLSGPTDSDPSCATSGVPSAYQDDCDIPAQAVENATAMGMTVVVSAGNDGQSGFLAASLNSIDSPGTAPDAITVGAATNGHLLFAAVRITGANVPATLQSMYAAADDGVKLSAPLTAPVKNVTAADATGLACAALPAGSFTGDVVLIERGTCDFSTKINNAQQAGASAVIIYQDASHPNDLPFSELGAENTGIPAFMIFNVSGAALASYLVSNTSAQATLDPTLQMYADTANLVTLFTSRGPSIDYSIKPELVAIGQGIYTATESLDPTGDLYDATGYTTVEGSSFAAAMVAGAAALVKQANPGFSEAQIKSALVNTAGISSTEITDNYSGYPLVTSVGAGKLNAALALTPGATVAPASVSFGWVGPNVVTATVETLTITNTGSATGSFHISLVPDPLAPDYSDDLVNVSTASLALAPGQSGTVEVSLSGTFQYPGIYDGGFAITGPNTALRVPYWYLVSDGVPANVLPIYDGTFSGTVGDTCWYLAFKVLDQYGIAIPNQPVTFGVQQGGGRQSSSSTCPAGIAPGPSTETNGYGIAWTNMDLGPSPGDQTFVGQTEGLTASFFATVRPAPSIGSVVDAASFQTGQGLAPGSYITIFGAALSDATQALSTDFLPYSMSGVSVSFYSTDGSQSWPGRLWYVSPTQINLQIPWELAGQSSARMTVNVGDVSLPYTVLLAAYLPAMFQANGLAVAQDEQYQLITVNNPAKTGQYVIIYANGLGAVANLPASGEASPGTVDATVVTPTVTIGGLAAQVLYSGLTPGSIGLYQIDVVIPADTPAGPQPVVIRQNGVNSQPANLPVQ